MSQSRLALITFLDEGGGTPPVQPPTGPVDPGYSPPWAQVPGGGGFPPVIWPRPHPSHPIMLPGMPGWGSGGVRPPTQPPRPWDPAFPTNPIQLPPWAGGWQPHPDNTLPPVGTTPPVEPPTGGGQPAYPMPPAAFVPIPLVAVFVPGIGY